ncbi:MAG TPA: hypothetical protein VFK02_33420 [Kofleriaceae bacterium]|nr:hypothetical protein [Kofleriaceae bacterium]
MSQLHHAVRLDAPGRHLAEIEARGARQLRVRYAVYGHDLSVRTNLRLRLRLGAAPVTRYEIVGVPEPGPAAARYQAWIGEPHPGPQVLATVTTTARWI